MTTQTIHSTKQRLLDVGLPMLLKHGYNDLGIQAVLVATGVPKGSFYHHFEDKQDFALQVIEQYMGAVHEALATALEDTSRPSLDRIRCFFEMTEESYRQQGYLGCLLGGLGQELSAANEVFRQRIDECIAEISTQLSRCLAEAKKTGDIAADADAERLASLLVDCWEGAALRSRLRRDVAPLDAMLDFYFGAVTAGAPARKTR